MDAGRFRLLGDARHGLEAVGERRMNMVGAPEIVVGELGSIGSIVRTDRDVGQEETSSKGDEFETL